MPDLVTLALAKSNTNRVALGEGAIGIKGDRGEQGIPGKEVELQSNGSFVQYRYVGDAAWINIVPLSDLKGAKGENGLKGDTGEKGEDGNDGSNGQNPEFRVVEDILSYKFPSQTDDEWVDIYTFTSSAYTLPTASETVLGGVKIGSGIAIDSNDVISTTGDSPPISDEDQEKLDSITIDGDGKKYLSNDGTYKTIEQSGDGRDFLTNPIDLTTEITGVLPIENVDTTSLQDQIDTNTENISEHETRITALESEHHFNWRGQFQLGNTYNTYDVVRAEDGSDYIATMDGLVLSPPSSGWDLFLEGGSGEAGEGRDFTENPINLGTEVTGKLAMDNIDVPELMELIPIPILHQTTGQDTLGGMSQKAVTDELNNHTGNNTIHVKAQVTNLTKTVNLADLQAEINALPKLLLANVIFNVNAGTIAGDIALRGFAGSGEIQINGATSTASTHNVRSFIIESCINPNIRVKGFKTNRTDSTSVNCSECSGTLVFENLRIIEGSSDVSTNRGIQTPFCPTVYVNNCEISNQYAALTPRQGSMFIQGITGVNNAYKFWPTLGGAVYLVATTNTLAGEILTNTAGLVVNPVGGIIG